MPLIQKPALQGLYNRAIADRRFDKKNLDELVAIVGDRKFLGVTWKSSNSVASQLDGKSDAEKIALAQKGLDAGEKADIHALLNDDKFKAVLDHESTNFLRAVIGLDPLPRPAPPPVQPTPVTVTPEPVRPPPAPPVVVKPFETRNVVVPKKPDVEVKPDVKPVVVEEKKPDVKPVVVEEQKPVVVEQKPVEVKPQVIEKPVEQKPVEVVKPPVVEMVKADPNDPAVKAVNQLKELIKSGDIRKYYDAAIGAVDNPELKQQALDLFNALPVVKPGMSAADFVKAGLWTQEPKGVAAMQDSARYLPGRQVLVETTCYSKVPAQSDPTYEAQRRKIGSYDPSGHTAVTYRATLVGEDPANKNNFIVAVDGPNGTPVNVSVTKQSIFSHNQPHELQKRYIQSDTKRDLPYGWGSSWSIDFASPLAKAKLAEVALKMDDFVSKIDFTKEHVSGGLIGNKKVADLQKSCVDTIFRSIDMKYPREDGQPFTDAGRAPQGTRDAARQAIRGTGMCVQQSTVMGALMTPFMDILGIDGQYRSGNCYRNIHGATDNVYAPDYASGHGWWQITLRPSMEMTVTDRTWNQVNLPLDRAYGFPYGDRYAAENITGFEPAAPTATDVNVTGDVTVKTLERQFSQVGDGREHHISLTQNDG